MSKFKIGDLYTDSFKTMSPQDVEANLEGVCYEIKEEGYTKPLTETDLAEKKTELAEISIVIAELEQKKKEINAELRAEIKKPKNERGALLDAIKHRSERVKGKLYLMDEPEDGMMYFFDSAGQCVNMRALMPSERQTKIRNIKSASNE